MEQKEQNEQNEHGNETSNEMVRLRKHISRLNWVVLASLMLICAMGIKYLIFATKTTVALSEVSQKVGVDFPTHTNNLFWTWQIVKPK